MDMSIGKRKIVVLIYTFALLVSLPFARIVWDYIGDELGYIILIGLYISSIVYIYYRYKNIIVLGIILLLSVAIFKIIPLPIERVHFIEYGILGWIVWWAVGNTKNRFLLAIVYILAISVLDEIIQKILPNRVFDIRDIWMNISGGCIGLLLRAYLHTN